jgi:hypothetical protein
MARQRCTSCSKSVPGTAKFCPRCGREVGATPGGDYVHPSRSRIPVAGLLFLSAAVLGPAFIIVGIYSGIALLVYVGIGIAVSLLLLSLLGLFF